MWTLVAFRGGLDSDEALPNAGVIIAPYPFMTKARCWLAWHDGEPAGAATLAIHDGVAGLFGASTRCRIATAGCSMRSIAARLAAAVNAGCDLAVVDTEPGSDSQRNVERLGFRLGYTKVTMTQRGANT